MKTGRIYRCIRGIQGYRTDLDYFISGKMYKCIGDFSLVDELGKSHIIHPSIVEEHFVLVSSNKRKRDGNKERE